VRSLQAYILVNRRKKRQARLSQSLRRRVGRGGFAVSSVAVLVLALVLVSISAAYANLISDLPSVAQLPVLLEPERGILMQPTRLYDRSGENLLLGA
jgi:hypothetical protein